MSLIHVVVNYIYSTGILNSVVNVIIVLCNVSFACLLMTFINNNIIKPLSLMSFKKRMTFEAPSNDKVLCYNIM